MEQGAGRTGRDSDNGVGDLLVEVGLRSLLHLGKNHGADFLGRKLTGLALVVDSNGGFSVDLLDLERPVLDVALNVTIVHLASNKTFGVEYGVAGVRVEGILGGVTDETLLSVECDPRRGDTVALVVGDDLYTSAPLYTVQRMSITRI